jgi:hypothetical protein
MKEKLINIQQEVRVDFFPPHRIVTNKFWGNCARCYKPLRHKAHN